MLDRVVELGVVAVGAGAWSLAQLNRDDQLVELIRPILSAKHSPLHLVGLEGTAAPLLIIVANRVGKSVRLRARTLLLLRGRHEPILGPSE